MMSFTRRLLALSAASAFLFGITACDDDSDDKPTNSNTNTCTVGTCSGNSACINGVLTPCQGLTPFCSAGACIAQPTQGDSCTNTVCEGNVFKQCLGGIAMPPQTCSGATPICTLDGCSANSAVPSACIDADYKANCSADGKLQTCVGGNIVANPCPTGQVCSNGACVANGNGGNTTPVVGESVVGGPCQCPAGNDSCLIKITGAEINGAVGTMVAGFIGDKKMADTDVVEAPNFFSQSITGCEALANAVPDGMVVGCLATKTITFPDKVKELANANFINDLLNSEQLKMFAPLIQGFLKDIDLNAIFAKLAPVFNDGITFTAQNGYCIAATIDIKGTLGGIGAMVLNQQNFNSLLSKINVGDHSKAVKATCPAGSTHLSYTVNKPVSLSGMDFGTFNVGFDMCLKSCNSNADCRESEGYACIEIPNGDASNGYAVPDPCKDESYEKDPNRFKKEKVCFDKGTKDYFEKLTKDFEGLLPQKLSCPQK